MTRDNTPVVTPLFPATTLVPAPAPAPLFKALAAVGLVAPFLSYGAIITVNTTNADGGAGDCSLRDAATAVRFPGSAINNCAVADLPPTANEIRFSANVVGTITYTNAHNVFNYSGVEFQPRSSLTITGPGASVLGVTCTSNTTPVGTMLVFANVASDISISGLGLNNCVSALGHSFGAGGLSVFGAFNNAVVNVALSDLTINGNTGPFGGLSVSSTGVTTLRRLSVIGNTGPQNGGAVVQGFFPIGDVNVQSSTFAGNTASSGPGGGLAVLTEGDISINNSTVSGNTGGFAALLAVGANVGINHSTIVRNVATPNATSYVGLAMGALGGMGSGAASIGTKALTVAGGLNNSIVCGNEFADYGAGINVVANYNLLGVPLVDRAFPGAFVGVGNVTGCTGAQLNGWLGSLANNGGSTPTHALLNVAGNPAINSGDPAFIGSPTDQTGGNARVGGSRTDMGAFEIVAAAAASNVAVPTTGAVGLGALSLALAALGMRRRKTTKAQG
jgi:hypothetical protein